MDEFVQNGIAQNAGYSCDVKKHLMSQLFLLGKYPMCIVLRLSIEASIVVKEKGGLQ